MSTEATESTAEQEEILGCLHRTDCILRLMKDAMHAGVQIKEADGLFETVQRELDQVFGLVTGDLVVTESGQVVVNVGTAKESPS